MLISKARLAIENLALRHQLAICADHRATQYSHQVVSDDYAASRDLFSQHQLCWAHLIRKAIKLALQNPQELQYAEFLDGLCSIYDDAKQLREDALAKDAPKASREDVVSQLQDRITSLCNRREETIITAKTAAKSESDIKPTAEPIATFILLQRELADNVDW